jgi:hypothetical protein
VGVAAIVTARFSPNAGAYPALQRNDTVSVELKKTRLEKERMSQDIEKLLSSPPKSPEQPEKTRVVPSIDATMVCFIDADGCEEAPAPILSASSDSPVSKSISTVKTTYQPTLVTPGASDPFLPPTAFMRM